MVVEPQGTPATERVEVWLRPPGCGVSRAASGSFRSSLRLETTLATETPAAAITAAAVMGRGM
jgi:hypothetical protein